MCLRRDRNFSALVTVVLVVCGCDNFLGPRDYDECILQSMKGVTSDSAAEDIRSACASKFSSVDLTDLPAAALKNFSGHGKRGPHGLYGDFYNGDKDWTVYQVTVRFGVKSKTDGTAEWLKDKEFNIAVTVDPLSSSNFSLALTDPLPENYSWEITRVRGHKS